MVCGGGNNKTWYCFFICMEMVPGCYYFIKFIALCF